MGKVGALKRGVERRQFRRRRRSQTLCFMTLCVFCLGAVVSATQGDDFLDAKEDQLAQVADAVKSNDVQKCGLLQTCAMNCSRHTCAPLTGDVNRFTCMPVTYNKYCKASDGGSCQDKNFDYTRSFVRKASNTAFTRDPTTIRTCAQRALDPLFQNISKPESLLRVYFGSIDGTFRSYPGSDQSASDCGVYDTRLRPWYRASTSVPKVVVILVDGGQSMSTPLSSGQGQGTILDAVKVIVREFFKTFNVQDYVNIIVFDSTKVTPLSPAMVQVQPYQNLSDTTYLPELDALWQSLDKQKSEDQPGTSDIAKGIDSALKNFATNYPDAASIILVLTDGKFAKASNLSIPVHELTASNVKVFMYKIPQPNDDMLFLGNTSFAGQLCSVGGSFDVISSDLANPILALNSFFTFTATLHAEVTKNSADYSIIFPGFEQIHGNITTVNRPVFGVDKTLLGVVGMDIFISTLGNLTDQVRTAIQNRSLGESFKPANFVLTSGGCSQLQTALPSPEPCGSGAAIPPNGGFCLQTDTTSSIEDLACCKSCAKPGDGGGGGGGKAGAIAGAVVGAIGAIGLVVFLVWFCNWRNKDKAGVGAIDVHDQPFPGSDTER